MKTKVLIVLLGAILSACGGGGSGGGGTNSAVAVVPTPSPTPTTTSSPATTFTYQRVSLDSSFLLPTFSVALRVFSRYRADAVPLYGFESGAFELGSFSQSTIAWDRASSALMLTGVPTFTRAELDPTVPGNGSTVARYLRTATTHPMFTDYNERAVATLSPIGSLSTYIWQLRRSVVTTFRDDPQRPLASFEGEQVHLIGPTTAPADMPTSGRGSLRTYNVSSIAADDSVEFFGWSDKPMTIDYANRTLSGTFLGAQNGGRDGTARLSVELTLAATYSAASGRIEGTLRSADGAVTGRVLGAFYGPGGEEVGLVAGMTFANGTRPIAGIIIGRR